MSATLPLVALQSQPHHTTINDPHAALQSMLATAVRPAASMTTTPQLHLLVRTPEQLDAALDLRPAVERVQRHGIVARMASPRILKPDEQRIVRFLLKLGCNIVVRSGGLLH